METDKNVLEVVSFLYSDHHNVIPPRFSFESEWIYEWMNQVT